MGELRKDYILDRWVLISSARGKRPHELVKEPAKVVEGACFFCKGNEKLTPTEIGRIPDGKGGWRIRWFENKFAAVGPGDACVPQTANGFFTWAQNCGDHEIIVETDEHKRQLADLSVDELADVLRVYRRRIDELGSRAGVAYVNVFKNHGVDAGTSIVHSHSQVITTASVPTDVQAEVAARNRFIECPYCRIVETERKSDRRCFENDEYVAFTPYASRFNYEVWVFPKRHLTVLDRADALADVLKRVLAKIDAMKWSYNIVLHYAPSGTDLHFHLEVCPRVAIWGGFELGSGVIINSVPPEEAARFYRGEPSP